MKKKKIGNRAVNVAKFFTKAGKRLKIVNLSGVLTVANNRDDQPLVFEGLTKREKYFVHTITGGYPQGWNPKTKKFLRPAGFSGKRKTSKTCLKLAAGL